MKRILGAIVAVLVAIFLNITPAMAAESAFPGCFVIGDNSLLGAPTFKADFIFDSSGKVTGEGEITQAVNPPISVETYLDGTYLDLVYMGAPYFKINADGYASPPCPECGPGPGPVRLENVKDLEISTLENVASYKYSKKLGDKFTSVGPVPVKSVPCPR